MSNDTTPAPPPAPKRRPRRQRTEIIASRCSTAEATIIRARAAEAGLAVGAFARASMLGDAGPRARKRLPVDHDLLLRHHADNNRIGNNINQLTRAFHTTGTLDIPELRAALDAYVKSHDLLLQALGHDPNPPPLAALPPPAPRRRKRKPAGGTGGA